jgi:hypothetical protein
MEKIQIRDNHPGSATLDLSPVEDPDTDRVGSASFCRIGIGTQGMPNRIRPIRIGIKSRNKRKS